MTNRSNPFPGHPLSIRGFDRPRGGQDYGRISLLPLPASVVGPELHPFELHAAYYIGDDEVVGLDEMGDLEHYAYEQWVLAGGEDAMLDFD